MSQKHEIDGQKYAIILRNAKKESIFFVLRSTFRNFAP